MNWTAGPLDSGRFPTFIAAVVVGLSVGTLVPPDPVTLPVVGAAPGPLVGGAGLVFGGGLLAMTRRSSGCGCSGDCGC